MTCSLGTHLNADQFQQLCEGPRAVYLTFDVDANQGGQQAAKATGPSSWHAWRRCSPRVAA